MDNVFVKTTPCSTHEIKTTSLRFTDLVSPLVTGALAGRRKNRVDDVAYKFLLVVDENELAMFNTRRKIAENFIRLYNCAPCVCWSFYRKEDEELLSEHTAQRKRRQQEKLDWRVSQKRINSSGSILSTKMYFLVKRREACHIIHIYYNSVGCSYLIIWLSQTVTTFATHCHSYVQKTTSNLPRGTWIFIHTHTKYHLYDHIQ